MDQATFRNPSKTFRAAPFWSWNDDLDPEELVRQVRLMDEAGWGGFFMHSRVGLVTPYLSEQWMECMRATVAEAKRRGMEAYLYDEDKWPSGFAGGLVPAQKREYRDLALVCKVDNRPAVIEESVALFKARFEAGQLSDFQPISAEEARALDWRRERLVQFYPLTAPLGQPWFNDTCYIDLLNPEAVRAFIESTYEPYYQQVGQDFGGAVPGIFTDEPTYNRRILAQMRPSFAPWTIGLEDYFQEKKGYDLLTRLPDLFFDTPTASQTRYDFWHTLTQRFLEAFSQQMYEWCQEHDLAFTGHYLAEDSLRSQTQHIGAAMPHYPYMHIPGIDKLGRQINAGPGTVLTVKQLDSIVCQLSKPRALCENYGCGGQDFAHTGRKWIGDWAYVLGINLNNPHLSLYSMRGERKRDHPQNIFYQQPWWPENRLIADYFARLSYVLSEGRRVVDILVIHPIGSAWALYRPGATYAVDQLDQALDDLLMALMQAQRDFHLGDEMLMEPGAPCEATVTTDDTGPRLDVGQMSYRVVIVPPGVTLAENTVQLLREFAAAGGAVLAVEPVPTLVNGRPTDDAVLPETTRLVTLRPGSGQALDTLPDVLDELLPFDVRVPGRPAIWAHHRRIDDADCYFLANTDLDNGGVATVQLRGTGRLESWDPATGDVRPLPSRQSDDVTEVVLDFPPVASHLLVLHRDQPPAVIEPTAERVVAEVTLDDTWQLALGGPNALTLDTPQVQIGDEDDWSEPMHILDAHGAVAEAGVGTIFALRFTFDADVRPAGPVYLVVESPGRFEIAVNGQPVAGDEGWWTDISFRKVDVSAAVQAGRNEVVLSGTFALDTELESVYLVGDFGVTGRRVGEENRFNGQVFDRYAPDFRVTDLPDRAQAQSGGLVLDLTAQGLAFFAGRVTLRQTVTLPALDGRTVLEIHNLRAAIAHVRVNGQQMGTVAWPPHRVDVTEGLRAGENVVEIELVGTLRNLLGPHHRAGGDLAWTGPRDFRDKSRWTDDYILVPFGFDGVTLKIFDRSRRAEGGD